MKNNKVEVSIITPAFNCRDTIKATYESINNQSFSNWEWIVIEDHSTDESFDYIKKMIANDDRVTLLRTDSNSGAAVARNVGIQAAKGRFISFLDADDLWMPDKLELQVKYMKQNGYALTCSNYQLLYKNGATKEFRLKKDKITYKMLLRSNYLGCLTVIYDSEQLGKVLMPLDCEKREDYGAWLDITRNGVVAHCLDKTLSIYRIGSYSVSSNKLRMIKYQYRVYRTHEKFCVFKSLWFVLLCSLNKIFRKY